MYRYCNIYIAKTKALIHFRGLQHVDTCKNPSLGGFSFIGSIISYIFLDVERFSCAGEAAAQLIYPFCFSNMQNDWFFS